MCKSEVKCIWKSDTYASLPFLQIARVPHNCQQWENIFSLLCAGTGTRHMYQAHETHWYCSRRKCSFQLLLGDLHLQTHRVLIGFDRTCPGDTFPDHLVFTSWHLPLVPSLGHAWAPVGFPGMLFTSAGWHLESHSYETGHYIYSWILLKFSSNYSHQIFFSLINCQRILENDLSTHSLIWI